VGKTSTFLKKSAWIELELHDNELCVKATGFSLKSDILMIFVDFPYFADFTDYVKGLTS
jgi:hypothetical protein